MYIFDVKKNLYKIDFNSKIDKVLEYKTEDINIGANANGIIIFNKSKVISTS